MLKQLALITTLGLAISAQAYTVTDIQTPDDRQAVTSEDLFVSPLSYKGVTLNQKINSGGAGQIDLSRGDGIHLDYSGYGAFDAKKPFTVSINKYWNALVITPNFSPIKDKTKKIQLVKKRITFTNKELMESGVDLEKWKQDIKNKKPVTIPKVLFDIYSTPQQKKAKLEERARYYWFFLKTNDHSDVSGLWYDKNFSGMGFSILQGYNGTNIQFYGYSKDGERLWLISETVANNWKPGKLVTIKLFEGFKGNGATFNKKPNKGSGVKPWGTLELVFNNCNSGVASLKGTDGKQTFQLSRLSQLQYSKCTKL